MAIVDGFRMELEHEGGNTRKMLALYPEDKAGWQPHPKSMTLQQLVSHLAEMIGWAKDNIETDGITFDPETYQPWLCKDKEDLLAHFDARMAEVKAVLNGVEDAHMMEPWTLKAGDHVFFTMPRVSTLRGMVFNHMIHHRGQLSVYYRLLGIPLPEIYGPTADGPFQG